MCSDSFFPRVHTLLMYYVTRCSCVTSHVAYCSNLAKSQSDASRSQERICSGREKMAAARNGKNGLLEKVRIKFFETQH